MSEFDSLVRGSVIMRWSPSGALSRFVVLSQSCMVLHAGGAYRVATLNDDNSVSIGAPVHEGFDVITREGIDEDEGFGYTYTFMLGVVYPVPEAFQL